MKKIRIISGKTLLEAELNDSMTASRIADILPFNGSVSRWGNEIYFSIPLSAGSENPQTVVKEGDIAYWPPGKAFCIFWGTTPASSGSEIRPASEVNIVGRILSGWDLLKMESIRPGDPIIVEAEEDVEYQ